MPGHFRGAHSNTLRVAMVGMFVATSILFVDGLPAHATPPILSRISVASGGQEGNNSSQTSAGSRSASGDGSLVVFASAASNLVAGDINGAEDVFLRNRVTSTTALISVGIGGAQANGGSRDAAISEDGRFVVFTSDASNLVAGDTNGSADIFVRDLQSQTTTRVTSLGGRLPAISADGRYITFEQWGGVYTSNDHTGSSDVYRADRTTGAISLVSVWAVGGQVGDSTISAISSDGRYVAFESDAGIVMPDANTTDGDIYVRDMVGNSSTRVSVSTAGAQGLGASSAPSISDDGRYVAFESDAALDPQDLNGDPDIYVRDRTNATTTRASVGSNGGSNGFSAFPSISGNGRFIAFDSDTTNLVPGDTNAVEDVFVRDLSAGTTARVSAASGIQGNGGSYLASISSTGRYVVFESDASNLVAGDSNGLGDVFVHDGGETVPPTISSLSANPPALSPNADGIKDSTVVSASLADDTPPITWILTMKDSAGIVVRSFSGSGSSVSQAWDGKDTNGATVLDGIYTALLSATDDWGNTGTSSTTITVDTIPPTVTSWLPATNANTLWKRPTVSAVLADDRTGIDASSPQLQIDGVNVSSTYQASTSTLSGIPGSDLSMDADHAPSVMFSDRAGNPATISSSFHVMSIQQEPLQASVPAVTTHVPSATQCPTTCSITFTGVRVHTGPHGVTINSSAHDGSGTLSRSVSLATAYVQYVDNLGATFTKAVTLSPVTRTDDISIDEAYLSSFTLPFADADQQYADVTVTAPLQAAKGSIATLKMDPTTIAAPCSDTSSASDPATCGGPISSGADPLGLPLNTTVTDPTEAQMASEDSVLPTAMATVLPDIDPAGTRPPSGDISWTQFDPGQIEIKVAIGADVNQLVQDHGDSPSALTPLHPGPWDAVDIQNGVDRNYMLSVPNGTEKLKVTAYAADSRVEYVQLTNDFATADALTANDPMANSGYQWNLYGSYGIAMQQAWDAGYFLWSDSGKRPIDSYRGNREIGLSIIDHPINGAHADLNGKLMGGYNFDNYTPLTQSQVRTDREGGCDVYIWDHHGTIVAGMNAMTNNQEGLAGVDWNGHLYSIVRTHGDCTPAGPPALWITEAEKYGEVINASYQRPDPEDLGECDEIRNAFQHGIITVTAYSEQGNRGTWPGRCGYTVTTSASADNGKPWSGDTVDGYVNVFAPGYYLSAPAGSLHDYYVNDSRMTGTSLAAPQVAGLVQLLYALGVPPRYLGSVVTYSATPYVGSICGGNPCGRVNAYRATKSALINGVFEDWTSAGLPDRWGKRDTCSGGSVVSKSTENSFSENGQIPDGSSSVTTRCTGSGYMELYQYHKVTAGWSYSFYVDARTTSSARPDWMQVKICFYDKYSNPMLPCSLDSLSSSNVGGGWGTFAKGIAAPAGADSVRIALRTTGNAATNYWDDTAFYARKPTAS